MKNGIRVSLAIILTLVVMLLAVTEAQDVGEGNSRESLSKLNDLRRKKADLLEVRHLQVKARFDQGVGDFVELMNSEHQWLQAKSAAVATEEERRKLLLEILANRRLMEKHVSIAVNQGNLGSDDLLLAKTATIDAKIQILESFPDEDVETVEP